MNTGQYFLSSRMKCYINIGKTTSILCLAREMLGENYKNAVLELNASDARGIEVVRNKIKVNSLSIYKSEIAELISIALPLLDVRTEESHLAIGSTQDHYLG